MNTPKISIIVPVYNVEEYLPKCLNYLKNQTLKDIEIICINDGSTDGSPEILKSFEQTDDRIIVINQENSGVSIARNNGLKNARGEYVMFVDSDDYLDINACQLIYDKIKQENSDLLIFNHYYLYTNGNIKTANDLNNIDEQSPFYFNNAPDDFFYILTGILGKLYKRSSINTNLKPKLIKGEDTLFFWEYCLGTNPKISILNEPLYYYLQRPNSTMYNFDNTANCELFKTIENILENTLFKNCSTNVQAKIIDRFAQSVYWELYSNRNKKFPPVYYQKAKWLLSFFDKYSKSKIRQLRYYTKLKKEILRSKNYKLINFANKVLSITNKPQRKIIKFCGFEIKIKHLKGEFKKEEYIIKKLKKEQANQIRDSYLLFDCLNGDVCECIDAYSLFVEMKKLGKKAYYVLFKNSELYEQLSKNNNLDGIIAIENPTKTHPSEFLEKTYNILLNCKAIITAYGFFSQRSEKFFYKNPYFQYVFIQHGPTYLKESVMYNGYLYKNRFNKILISSEQEYKIFKKFKWDDKKLLKVGLPRWDLLKNEYNPTKEKSILIMLTWRRFQKNIFNESLYRKNLLSLLNNKQLQEYIKSKNVKLYFAPHHSLKHLRGINFNPSIENIEIADTNKISTYIKECSCLITDFSSIAFDFMFQNKPVLCYLLDKKDPLLGQLDRQDMECFDYKQYIFPNVFFEEETLIKKLKYYIEQDFIIEQEIKNKYNQFFYTKENIRKQLINEIDNACLENIKT